MARLKKCRTCGYMIPKSAKSCPHCGRKRLFGRWSERITLGFSRAGGFFSSWRSEADPPAETEESASVTKSE